MGYTDQTVKIMKPLPLDPNKYKISKMSIYKSLKCAQTEFMELLSKVKEHFSQIENSELKCTQKLLLMNSICSPYKFDSLSQKIEEQD